MEREEDQKAIRRGGGPENKYLIDRDKLEQIRLGGSRPSTGRIW